MGVWGRPPRQIYVPPPMMSDCFEGKLDMTVVQVHCVVITAQVDMNFIVVCERIMELQPSKKMNLMMMNES